MIRLSLPEHIPLSWAGIFASALFVTQQIQHTGLYFSACCFIFVMLTAIAVNISGGLSRPSGGYVFFYATLAVIVGLCAKAVIGERADSNVLRPRLTITVFTVGMAVLALTALVARRFTPKRPLLAGLSTDRSLYAASIGCLVIGSFLTVGTHVIPRGPGSVWSALFQVNRFSELAIILGTIDVIRRSGGRRSMNVPVFLACAVIFVAGGILGFSKEAMFSPFVCWFVAAAAERYRISRNQIILLGLSIVFTTYYLVPYSQYGRTQVASTFVGNIQVAEKLLANLPRVRTIFVDLEKQDIANGVGGYFNKPEGLLDRLQMISVDSELIDATETHGAIGYYPILEDFEALTPHVFWPDKPAVLWGNVYAHEAGVNISEDDFTTGVSFSPTAEGYHLGKWVGILLLCPAIWLLTFLIFDSLCGDIRASPWGLLVITYFAHAAPEGYLSGLIYADGYVAFAIIFAAVTTGYLMPIIGSLFIGPTEQRTQRNLRLQPQFRPARTPVPLPPPEA